MNEGRGGQQDPERREMRTHVLCLGNQYVPPVNARP